MPDFAAKTKIGFVGDFAAAATGLESSIRASNCFDRSCCLASASKASGIRFGLSLHFGVFASSYWRNCFNRSFGRGPD